MVDAGEIHGWPCYEGAGRMASYDNLNLNLCETLYAQGAAAQGQGAAQGLVGTAGDRLAVPGAVLSAGLERPPVEVIAVTDRDRGFVFLDAALHLLEQSVEQRFVLRLPMPEEIVLFR